MLQLPFSIDNINSQGDAALISACRQADAMLQGVKGWDDAEASTYPSTDAEAMRSHATGWELTRRAMTYKPATLAGARQQLALLLLHIECNGSGGGNADIEIQPLKNLLRLLPTGA